MLAYLIEAEGPARLQDVPDTLEFLQEFVGGYLEGLTIPSEGLAFGLHAYMNEDGKALGLPINEVATRLLYPILRPGDAITGNLMIVGSDAEGDHVSLPEDFHPSEYFYPL